MCEDERDAYAPLAGALAIARVRVPHLVVTHYVCKPGCADLLRELGSRRLARGKRALSSVLPVLSGGQGTVSGASEVSEGMRSHFKTQK